MSVMGFHPYTSRMHVWGGETVCLCFPGASALPLRIPVNLPPSSPPSSPQVLVSAVAQVGLDVNLAANVSWRRDCLQYVPGLGPRKARALMEAMQVRRGGGWGGEGRGWDKRRSRGAAEPWREKGSELYLAPPYPSLHPLSAPAQRNGSRVESRNELYRELAVLRKTVFRNCGPFLRVSSAGLPQLTNLEFRLLDATRVHPESYRLVRGAGRGRGGEQVHPESYRLHFFTLPCPILLPDPPPHFFTLPGCRSVRQGQQGRGGCGGGCGGVR